MMATEKEWVETFLRPELYTALQSCGDDKCKVGVDSGKRLTYAYEILKYRDEKPELHQSAGYETDLLIYDTEDGLWMPRVVLECKKGGVTTHDALTYSSKAATHKHVHPYLRYGVLIGDFGPALPGRLIRHGVYFDFMMAWSSDKPTTTEWSMVVDVIKKELAASRDLYAILSDTRSKKRPKYWLLHRPLVLTKLEKKR